MHGPPALTIAGLVLLAVAGAIARGGKLAPAKIRTGMLFAIPGAALVGMPLERPDWMAPAVVAAIVVAAPLVADADLRWGEAGWGGAGWGGAGWARGGPAAFAIAAAGVFGCVPDTEEASVLLVVAGVAGVISLVTPWKALGAPVAFASAGVLVWVAAFDARGRPAAFVGAVASLGLLVWEPLGVRVRGAHAARVRGRAAMLGAAIAHIALVAYASRVVGLERSVGSAVLLAVPAVVAGIAAGVLVGPDPRSAPRSRS